MYLLTRNTIARDTLGVEWGRIVRDSSNRPYDPNDKPSTPSSN